MPDPRSASRARRGRPPATLARSNSARRLASGVRANSGPDPSASGSPERTGAAAGAAAGSSARVRPMVAFGAQIAPRVQAVAADLQAGSRAPARNARLGLKSRGGQPAAPIDTRPAACARQRRPDCKGGRPARIALAKAPGVELPAHGKAVATQPCSNPPPCRAPFHITSGIPANHRYHGGSDAESCTDSEHRSAEPLLPLAV